MINNNVDPLKHESIRLKNQLSFGKTVWNFIPIYFVLFLLFINSCQILTKSGNKVKELSKCKFELLSVDKKVSFTEPTANIWNYVIKFNIACINPNSENITLGSYKLRLYANDKWISDIVEQVPVILIPNDTTIIIAKTIISPSGVLSVFWKKLLNKEITYKLECTFFLKLENYSLPIKIQLLKVVDNPN